MPRPLLGFAFSVALVAGAPWLRAQSTFGSVVGSTKDASVALDGD